MPPNDNSEKPDHAKLQKHRSKVESITGMKKADLDEIFVYGKTYEEIIDALVNKLKSAPKKKGGGKPA